MIKIRLAEDSDANLIINSWMESYRHSEFAKFMTKFTYNINHRALVLEALKRSDVYCAVAKDDADQIYGWVCIEPGSVQCLHYIYVKQPFRELDIAHKLLAHAIQKDATFSFSHLAQDGMAKYLFSEAVYDPYRFLKEHKNV